MKVIADDNMLWDLEQYRSYLTLLADLQLRPRLRVKAGASDIVQQTMFDAHRDLAGFRGKSEAELRAWLKVILNNNLHALGRRYRTLKRNARLEVTLQEQQSRSSVRLHHHLVADQSSPSTALSRMERTEQLTEALLKLLEDERTAVILKHYHNWPVAEIAVHLGRTQVAVAGLLRRGLKKLREHIRA